MHDHHLVQNNGGVSVQKVLLVFHHDTNLQNPQIELANLDNFSFLMHKFVYVADNSLASNNILHPYNETRLEACHLCICHNGQRCGINPPCSYLAYEPLQIQHEHSILY